MPSVQVQNNIISSGTLASNNLVHNGTTITRATVFGNNNITADGYITPLPFAANAPRLEAGDIIVPTGKTAVDILSKLETDKIGYARPTSGEVTFGSIEVEIIPPTPTYTITLITPTNGQVTSAPSDLTNIDSGTSVSLTAIPDADYKFVD